jgi:ankyrin repeat protein
MTRARSLLTLIAVAALTLPAQASPLDDLFGDAPIVRAAREGSVKDMNAAMVAGEPATKRAADGTPVLVLAVGARSLDVVKILIENGARPDDKSRDETTALTLASSNGDYDIAEYLLDHKADVNLPGALREAPLIKATRARHASIVGLLIERGADIEDTDSSGATALDIAQRNNQTAIVALLTKASKK